MPDHEQSGHAKEMHPAPSSASSAASRVFAITELLEIILLNVVKIETSHRDPHNIYKNFIRSPILLQAVNSSFQATIKGSQALLDQCLMPYLTPDRGNLNRIWWLLNWHSDVFRVSKQFEIQLGRRVLREDVIMLRRGPFLRPCMIELDTAEEASWRRVPCIQRQYAPFEMRVRAKCSCAGCIGYYSTALSVKNDTTLGELWNKLHGMLAEVDLLRRSRHSLT